MSFVIYGVLVLLAFIQGGNGLRCYHCNSKDSITCARGLPYSDPTQECKGGFIDTIFGSKCYTVTAESKDGQFYVERSCLPSGAIGCKYIASALGWFSSQSSNEGNSVRSIDCDTCSSDRCNSAGRITEVERVKELTPITISGSNDAPNINGRLTPIITLLSTSSSNNAPNINAKFTTTLCQVLCSSFVILFYTKQY